LFIKRFGKWDLPKGKIEAGESPGQAALREVLEECGIRATLYQALPSTYHIYTLDGTRILKRTWWFSMGYSGEPATVPQREEGITEAIWLVPSRFDMVLDNTYRSLAALLEDIPWEEEGLRTC
jgi:8-oxo-dGTP pyrophosphatase MutT (NUDIX family)